MKLRFVLIFFLLSIPLLRAQVANPRLWIASDFGGKSHGSIASTDLSGKDLQAIKIFEGDPMGADPSGGLIKGLDGNFYGVTSRGGSFDKGIIYRIAASDNSFTKLFEFNGTSQGRYPMGNLVQAANGKLFGVTNGGGASGKGTLYKIESDGSGFATLVNFNGSNGYYPNFGPEKGVDGNFYGTLDGGANTNGIIYKVTPDGAFTKLFDFNKPTTGSDPTPLMQSSDGKLYGMTNSNVNSRSTLYKINSDGSGFTTLFEFGDNEGSGPVGSLVEDADGFLYGVMTHGSGGSYLGNVFKIKKDGTFYQVLIEFDDSKGWGLNDGLTLNQNGELFGANSYGGGNKRGIVFKVDTDGNNFTKLLDHDADSGVPTGSLLISDSYLLVAYSVVNSSGSGLNQEGTILKVKQDGSERVYAHQFYVPNDGRGTTHFIQSSTYDIWGVSENGGEFNDGVIFKIKPNGSEYSKLIDFNVNGGNGSTPTYIIEGPDRYLFGVTKYGGENNLGVLFKINPANNTFEKLMDFDGTTTGALPTSLFLSNDGFLYGTTNHSSVSKARIFRIRPDGSEFQTLVDFSVSGEEVYLRSALIQASDGLLYGVAEGGMFGKGFIYKVHPDGPEFERLFSFSEYSGWGPFGPLIEKSDEFLWGATFFGGAGSEQGLGTVYKIKKDGADFSVMHYFRNDLKGAEPVYGLISVDDRFYGKTIAGGTTDGGTIFTLTELGTDFKVILDESSVNGLINGGGNLLSVSMKNQTINFSAIGTKNQDDAPFMLSAVSSTGLPVTFSTDSKKIELIGNRVVIKEPGEVPISASQTGDSYYASISITQRFCIIPRKPVLSLQGSTLVSSYTLENEWYLNGNLIEGASGNSLIPIESGNYSVKATVEKCESEFSEVVAVTITGLNKTVESKISFFPNPVQDVLTIDNNSESGNTKISIYDMMGREKATLLNANQSKFFIDTSLYPKGCYVIVVVNGASRLQEKFIKN